MDCQSNPVQKLTDTIERLFRYRGGSLYAVRLISLQKTEWKQGTVGIGCGNLWYDPSYVNQSKDNTLLAVMVHEACHSLLGHTAWLYHIIEQDRDNQKVYEYAAEFVVNNIVRRSQIGSLPETAVVPEAYGLPVDMTFDWYVETLKEMAKNEKQNPEQKDKQQQGTDKNSGGQLSQGGSEESEKDVGDEQVPEAGSTSSISDNASMSEDQPGDVSDKDSTALSDKLGEDKTKQAGGPTADDDAESVAGSSDTQTKKSSAPGNKTSLTVAQDVVDDGYDSLANAHLGSSVQLELSVKASSQIGTLPAWAEEQITVLKNSNKHNALAVLKELLQMYRGGTSWHKASRRSSAFPGKTKKRELIEILVAPDVSGSVTNEMFSKMWQYLRDLSIQFPKARFTVLQWMDQVILPEIIYQPGMFPVTCTRRGAGGTVPQCVFAWIKGQQKKKRYQGVAFLTDGYFHLEQSDRPSYPVVWLLPPQSPCKPCFGKIGYF